MRRTFLLHHRMPTPPSHLLIWAIGGLVLCPLLATVGQAHAQTPITQSGLSTQVSAPVILPSGQTQYTITGGTRPGGGSNLFHSFGTFNVPSNNIANFLNNSGLPTSNILGRVTGGNPSAIFGMIQTTGFGNANLFLMNPAGFLFGPNATLNVGGMVAFTTADYLRLADGVHFNAMPNAASDALLTPAPVAAFGFLGPNPAAIAIQGSTLKVADGQTLSLVGGNQGFIATDPDTGNPIPVPGGITMTGGKLLAPGGQINIASVAGPGEISAVDFMPTSGTTMGNISLSQGALVDVSADGAGTVRIRGGQLSIDKATVSANTANVDGSPTAIDININGNMSLTNELAPALSAQTTGSGNAGAISIRSGNLEAIGSAPADAIVALIDTHTSGTGTAGSVGITTGNLHATSNSAHQTLFIDSGTAGTGHGGDVTVQADTIVMENAVIATGNYRFGILLGLDVSGSGGNVTMKAAESVEMINSSISTEAYFAQSGNISLEARDILMQKGQVALDADVGGATIKVNADRLRLDDHSTITNNTVVDPGGDTTINARVVELTRGSFIQTSTLGDAKAGNIKVTATERLTIDGTDQTSGASGLISSILPDSFGTVGGSGSITVTTPRLEMFRGGIINTTSRSSGNAGDISIFANSITISGERTAPDLSSSPLEVGSTRGSGIYTRTVGSDLCVGTCGTGGNVTITTNSLTLDSGGTINSGTTNSGGGGNITINATDSINISGTTTDGTPSGIYSRTVGQMADAGSGGSITITAGQSVTMNSGSTISASSTGLGNTGNININAGNQFAMTNSSVTTEATQSGGGIIKITTNPSGGVELTNSVISASVLNGAGGGGSVNIDPQSVVLLNSQILARAVEGPGGNISITTNLLLPDTLSVISASSQFGQQGTVNIQSPISPASGKIVPLGQKPLMATSLLSQRCAALAGGNISSFTVAGRDTLPVEPGSWISYPIALSIPESDAGNVKEADGSIPDQSPLLSLRKIAPPGFLTQAFAVESSGCQS